MFLKEFELYHKNRQFYVLKGGQMNLTHFSKYPHEINLTFYLCLAFRQEIYFTIPYIIFHFIISKNLKV
ncbi:hypothetical protein MsedC_1858 [Metallosphaera sedula]|uniref:Uncharacterized protein n=1 Tax=Metallosphaera sedula TaxID=43687 RepID=A0A0K1SQC9_9CREN|nr:hypothetical protein MsedA_1858 [Metallosphaera sedula]AKV77022.1 hypothetical protein MsedB_1860 [Metallosphaera sedula]AKV79274.1 hypothetical protein MsedC_1858 [Metallosphaera sedula]AKV81519.1 hypothetical protein MsedD_1859 [Metallosphaera sedula]AKV83752.1 hypothetical protein MsedE_1859 [Metallosphaera sedula]